MYIDAINVITSYLYLFCAAYQTCIVLSFAPLTEAGIIEDAHARDGPCAHVNVHHETLKFAGLRAPRLSCRFAFLSFTIARRNQAI